MQAMSLNFALAQKPKSERPCNRYERYISYQWYFKWFI